MTAVPLLPLHREPELSNQLANNVRRAGSGPKTADSAEDPRIKEAATQFEAVFLRQMLSSLEKTTSSSNGTQASGSSIYGSMVVNTVADAIAKAGGLGLADLLTKSLQVAQQGALGPHTTSGAGTTQARPISGATVASGEHNGGVRRQ